ncbi:MAG: SgcJ/EcaC family oxidoreductase [Pseudomonadota bacterium]
MESQLKRLGFVSTLALGLLTEEAVSQTQGDLGPQGVSDAVAATVQNVVTTQTKALATGDFETYASFWAENGMLMPMRESRIGGRDNIVKYVEANFKANTNVTYSDWQVAGREDLVVVTNNANIVFPEGEKQESIDQIIVLRDYGEAGWLVQSAIWTLDEPE